MSPTASTTTTASAPTAKPRDARRLSPEFSELLHMLSSLDAKPVAGNGKAVKD